ncbi:MAG: riboflavin synthase [Solirubrobacteraceae bacterium]|nr:riboflavin synthase [Solirubrobacteraceae bacterium]
MFTGLVEDLGELEAIDAGSEGARLTIRSKLAPEIGAGDSVAINGVCLTATGIDGSSFDVEAMNETLARTALGSAEPGDRLNLELALRPDSRLGGHIVQGHVDGVGTVRGTREEGIARVVTIGADADLLRYVVEKGSVALDGVSLTVARVDGESFDVWLIPETLERTNLSAADSGAPVNIEVDIVAKYVEKLAGGAR